MNDAKCAFILGAGFSKDVADLLTLSELSNEIFARIDKDLPHAVLHFLKNDVPQSLWHDVESLLTYLYTGLPWSDAINSNLRTASFHALAELVCKIIKEKETEFRNQDKKPPNEDLKLLISYWQEMDSPVVTFNYDKVIELALIRCVWGRFPLRDPRPVTIFGHHFKALPEPCITVTEKSIELHVQLGYHEKNLVNENTLDGWKQKLHTYLEDTKQNTQERKRAISSIELGAFSHFILPFYLYRLPLGGKDQGQSFPDPKESVFSYYKLHGSVNWFYSGLHEVIDEPIYYRPSDAISTTGLVPVIIPPVLDKNSFYKNHTLQIQWHNALVALQDSSITTFYFVGYSLIPTDMIARYLFQDALKNKKGSVRIFIVNRFENEDEKKQLLRNYLATLAGLSTKQIANEIKNIKPSDSQLTPMDNNITFDWSLCSATGSTVHALVENLRNQAL